MSDAVAPEEAERIPYGADFTPTTLGRVLGEDAVLPWLLKAASGAKRSTFAADVATTCLSHIPGEKDRRDMASHVYNGLIQYGLVAVEGDALALTPVGVRLRDASDEDRDALFARHIVASCNGQRFLDAIRRYELRGETPDMEDLSIELGEPATSKNLSAIRAWLARAGVVSTKGSYRLLPGGLDRVLGAGVAKLHGIDRNGLEFMLAARLLQHQQGPGPLDAVAVAQLAESRGENVRIRRKSLGSFVKTLADRAHVKLVDSLAGKGGSRTGFELLPAAINVTDDQLRELLAQSEVGFALSDLLPLAVVVADLAEGNAEKRGRYGEQLAVHLCLMLGLRVRAWRKRAPHAEIDIVAERLTALTYQRWMIQVKNTDGSLDADQVDRELGATVGLGVSHVLFVVPRAEATEPALREVRTKARLTHLHVYVLTASMLSEKRAESLLAHLHEQAHAQRAEKRDEAEARERR